VLIIGERINSSIKNIEKSIKEKDEVFIQNETTNQIIAGASMIDLNSGVFLKTEAEDLVWLIETAHNAPEMKMNDQIGIAIDSTNPEVVESGLKAMVKFEKSCKTIINSVTADKEKLDKILPLVKKYHARLVGMCMDDSGIPESPMDRFQLGMKILKIADDYGVQKEDILLDPLVLPISTDIKNSTRTLETIKLLKAENKEIKTVIGLSNISYGLPMKNLLNRTFIVMAMAVGLDGAILNPLDKQLVSTIKASDSLLEKDDYCMRYITSYRNDELSG